MQQRTSIFTTQFWLLCTSNFLFSASFQMMIPELPDFLSSMGGKQYIGLIIALFTFTAGFSRPFSGKITDTVGRIPVMAFGSIICFVCSLVYPMVHIVAGFLLLRFVHGFSTGTKPTATAAYVADIIPENRRGEAAGMLGIFTAIGMSMGPTIGSFVADHFSLNSMFYISSGLALLSILILLNMEETLLEKQPLKLSLFKISWIDVYEPRVKNVFWVMLLVSFSSGAAITLAPDQSKALGLMNKGMFFTVSTLASLVIRVFFSKTSDKYGRVPVMIVSAFVMVLGMVLMGFADSAWVFYVASILFGFSWGMNSPTLTAWTVDLSDPHYRGRAIATMYIALEFGIGIGAYASGLIYQGNLDNIALCYWISAGLAAVATVYLVIINRQDLTTLEELSKLETPQ